MAACVPPSFGSRIVMRKVHNAGMMEANIGEMLRRRALEVKEKLQDLRGKDGNDREAFRAAYNEREQRGGGREGCLAAEGVQESRPQNSLIMTERGPHSQMARGPEV
jgi:hypothetical protein